MGDQWDHDDRLVRLARWPGLESDAPAFLANDIDSEVLAELTAEDLIGFGVTSIGHRRKLLAAIARLKSGENVVATPPRETATSAERRQLSVMFCDLVGSTPPSARLDAHGQPLAVRIGIATGIVVVGDLVGRGDAQERGLVGETPNLAARALPCSRRSILPASKERNPWRVARRTAFPASADRHRISERSPRTAGGRGRHSPPAG
ncbi:MAG: hypothetical protein J0J01_12365 [Reyranella sp.]|nr:hypothetical protein [Reyranella sp.]